MPVFPFSETRNHMRETRAGRKAYWNIAQERKRMLKFVPGPKKAFYPGSRRVTGD